MAASEPPDDPPEHPDDEEPLPGHAGELVKLTYDELSAVAHALISRTRNASAPSTGTLVNEVYLRIERQMRTSGRVPWNDRPGFVRWAARVMWNLILDRLRRTRRDGEVSLDTGNAPGVAPDTSLDLIAFDVALGELARERPRWATVVRMRLLRFRMQEIADALGVSPKSVDIYWREGKRWLESRLEGEAAR